MTGPDMTGPDMTDPDLTSPSRSGLPPLRWLRRLWPQKVRTKLTVTYAALFLAGGCALLGLTYGLVAANLSAHPRASGKPIMSASEYVKLCKKPAPTKDSPGREQSETRRKLIVA